MAIALLSELGEDGREFNLQFSRLNLGIALNSGERLNAMVGDFRNECFDEKQGLGRHAFLRSARIPTRRFAQEQLAAQILAQAISYKTTGNFTRTRHLDLQIFSKDHARFSEEVKSVVSELRGVLDRLNEAITEPRVLRNRATVLTIVLFALIENLSPDDYAALGEFVPRFVADVDEAGGLDPSDTNETTLQLQEFQRHVRQASVERQAVENRHEIFKERFEVYQAEVSN